MTRPLTPAGAAATAAATSADADALRAALEAAGGHVGKAARALGVCRRTLDRRITATPGLRVWLRDAYPRAAVMRAALAPRAEAAATAADRAPRRPRGRPRKIDRAPENNPGP